jgi:coproporphyrinogen III oxidase
MKEQFTQFIHDLQNQICKALEAIDGKETFKEDAWVRPEGGGGKTRVLANGAVFEKGGVNTSIVHGPLPEAMKDKIKKEDASFFACGISLVIHPNNPMLPTVHANYRYFELYDGKGTKIDAWFGGGSDLTPYYLFDEDAKHFHQTLKNACDSIDEAFYPKYKKTCDEYFYNSHRNEGRGIGGIFYDYLKPDANHSEADYLDFAKANGQAFLDAYLPIVEKRKDQAYTAEQRYFQEIRRGRYVEFNLIHDRGTHFGLKSNGRTESILMSLPNLVRWDYDFQVQEGSPEARLIEVLQNPIDWV